METPKLITGPWRLEDLRDGRIGSPKNGMRVFTCFHCGGGSTMGYKLAGYDVVGGVEIDGDMMKLYRQNHGPNPELSFQMPIQDFAIMPKIPEELFDIDVLDGSPPCSSFSMSGSREDGWSEKKMFREGQTEQVLDDLFFHFINVAERLRPKVVIAENVKGLILGNARGYIKDIFKAFDKAGYSAQLFLLNASMMGVAQKRERTFFIARRKDLNIPKIVFDFNEPQIPASIAIDGAEKRDANGLTPAVSPLWEKCLPGRSLSTVHPKGHFFTHHKLSANKPSPTIVATSGSSLNHWSEPRQLSTGEVIRLQSFPDDYNFLDVNGRYVCGMSVPPLMMQRVATEVYRQLLSPLRIS